MFLWQVGAEAAEKRQPSPAFHKQLIRREFRGRIKAPGSLDLNNISGRLPKNKISLINVWQENASDARVYCCLFVVPQIPAGFLHCRVYLKESVFSLLVSSLAIEGADCGTAQIRGRGARIPHRIISWLLTGLRCLGKLAPPRPTLPLLAEEMVVQT